MLKKGMLKIEMWVLCFVDRVDVDHVSEIAGGGAAAVVAALGQRGAEADPGRHQWAEDLPGVRRRREGGEYLPPAADLPHHSEQDRQAFHHLPGEHSQSQGRAKLSELVADERPFQVVVALLKEAKPMRIRAALSRDGVEVYGDHVNMSPDESRTILLQVRNTRSIVYKKHREIQYSYVSKIDQNSNSLVAYFVS